MTTTEIAEYVGKKHSYSGDIRRDATSLEWPVIPEPTNHQTVLDTPFRSVLNQHCAVNKIALVD
jgi:hypothetical protein